MRTPLKHAALAVMALAVCLFSPFAAAKDGLVEVKGTVTEMPASGFVGDWTIGGKAVRSTADTVIDQSDGPLVVGASVEAKGTIGDGGVLLATKIDVQASEGTPPPAGDPPAPPTGGTKPLELKGTVTAMPASGFVGDWTIGGKAVKSTDATIIDQEEGPLVVGAMVEVKGTPGDGGVILATRIEVDTSGPESDDDGMDDDSTDGELKGPIEALPDGTFIGNWKVAGQTVIVLTTTRLDQEDGGFVVGAIVEVHGTPGPDGLVASKIETKSSSQPPEPEDDELKIEGLIESLPADGLVGVWKVAGVDVTVTDTTKLDASDGPFVVGAPVEVKGFPAAGGGIEATKIETESGNGAHEPALVFFGAVEAMPPAGLIGVWTIAGRTVNVTDATELQEEDGPFAVGASVKVKGWLQDDGTVEAREIETVSSLPTAFTDAAPKAVEFFNANLGHFFLTASKTEIAALDAGAFNGAWVRTGATIKVGGSTAVCRFYGMPPKGPDSHFFTVNAAECQKVMSQYQAWTFENHAFAMTPPVNGACPAGLVPVHRFYNNPSAGTSMNHRYAIDAAVMQQMLAQGWIDEGVVMCAQP
ncbi:MAG: DUF5666 domain-containing protein [Burkholderiales bacterium]